MSDVLARKGRLGGPEVLEGSRRDFFGIEAGSFQQKKKGTDERQRKRAAEDTHRSSRNRALKERVAGDPMKWFVRLTHTG